MPIQLTGAILAREVHTDAAGRFHIVDPITSVVFPVKARERLAQTDKNGIAADLPPCVAVLNLWGGAPGQKYMLTATITSPVGDTAPFQVNENTWPDTPSLRLTINIKGQFGFERSGLYKFKYLIDGEPIGELALPAYWEDEVPK